MNLTKSTDLSFSVFALRYKKRFISFRFRFELFFFCFINLNNLCASLYFESLDWRSLFFGTKFLCRSDHRNKKKKKKSKPTTIRFVNSTWKQYFFFFFFFRFHRLAYILSVYSFFRSSSSYFIFFLYFVFDPFVRSFKNSLFFFFFVIQNLFYHTTFNVINKQQEKMKCTVQNIFLNFN